MKTYWIYLLTIASMLYTTSCIKDPVVGDLITVNEVKASLQPIFFIYLGDTTVRIQPVLHQTLANNINNLSFEWRYSSLGVAHAESTPVFGTGMYLDWTITGQDQIFNHFFWLEIKDDITGLSYPFYTRISVIKPFVNVWTVLHSNGGNSPAKLGVVEFLQDNETPALVELDVFTQFAQPLTGAPVALGADNYTRASLTNSTTEWVTNTLYVITTNPNETGLYNPSEKFSPYVRGVFIPEMLCTGADDFEVSKTTYIRRSNSEGGAVLNNRQLFLLGHGLRMYKAQINPALGDIRIDKMLRVGSATIMFDGLNRQFLFHNGRPNTTLGDRPCRDNEFPNLIQPMERAANDSIASLNNIPSNLNVLHIGVGNRPSNQSRFSDVKSFALANDDAGNTHIWFFPTTFQITGSTANATIERVREIKTPSGLNEQSHFTSSMAYNNIVFYSSGNRVFRLDLSTGIAMPIYTHAAGGDIVALNMAKEDPMTDIWGQGTDILGIYDTDTYGHAIDRSLGIAINRGTGGELVVLHLSYAGLVEKTQIFTGFGLIKDICFLAPMREF